MLKEYSQDGDTLHLPLDKPGIVTFAALTSMILAIAEFLDSGVPGEAYLTSHSPGNREAHENWYKQCRRSLTLRPEREKRHLDDVRIHVLEAMYHLMLENFQESSRAITEAVELALCLDLNKEASWETTSNRERSWRRVLWWTLYLFDREIAQKVGRTYLIPDKEVLVDDFSNCFSDMHISAGGSQYSASAQLHDIHNASPMSSPSSDPYDKDWYYYLQFLVAWTRLKTKFWDALVGWEALKAGDADVIEAIEALLLKLKRNLPDHMQWENYVLADCIRDGVPDCKIRLRLLIFTVCVPILPSTHFMSYSGCILGFGFLGHIGRSPANPAPREQIVSGCWSIIICFSRNHMRRDLAHLQPQTASTPSSCVEQLRHPHLKQSPRT